MSVTPLHLCCLEFSCNRHISFRTHGHSCSARTLVLYNYLFISFLDIQRRHTTVIWSSIFFFFFYYSYNQFFFVAMNKEKYWNKFTLSDSWRAHFEKPLLNSFQRNISPSPTSNCIRSLQYCNRI